MVFAGLLKFIAAFQLGRKIVKFWTENCSSCEIYSTNSPTQSSHWLLVAYRRYTMVVTRCRWWTLFCADPRTRISSICGVQWVTWCIRSNRATSACFWDVFSVRWEPATARWAFFY